MLKNSNSSSSSPPSPSQDSGLCSVVALSTITAAAFSSCGHMMMMNRRAFDPSTIFSALHFPRFDSCAIARTTPILTYSGSYAMPSYLLFQNSQVCLQCHSFFPFCLREHLALSTTNSLSQYYFRLRSLLYLLGSCASRQDSPQLLQCGDT